MLTSQADPVPIREESDGTLRVCGSRVLLELILQAFEGGASPEAIVQRYSTLRLPDVYSVISHYLDHREEMAEYVKLRERRASLEEGSGHPVSSRLAEKGRPTRLRAIRPLLR